MFPRSRISSIPVLMDSDPFFLLLIGHYDANLIGKAKRLKHYRPIHFDIMSQFIAGRKIYITSGVLAEVSNLSEFAVKSKKLKEFFKNIISQLQRIGERVISKDIIINNPAFPRLGYTDSSLLESAKDGDIELLTADHHLYSRCRKLGLKVTHMKSIEEIAFAFS